MSASVIILSLILFVANGTLVVSECCRKKEKKKQLAMLRKIKLAEGVLDSEIDDNALEDEIEPRQLYSWIFGIVVSIDIWLVGAVLTHLWAEYFFTDVDNGDSRKALFGDSFGAVNALVSAFAFAGMIVAFVLQRYELRLQRKELCDQRKEFQQQNQTLAFQRFENTFFNMLELQQQIVSDLYIEEEVKDWVEEDNPTPQNGRLRKQILINRVFRGRDFFRYAFVESIHKIGKEEVSGMGSVMHHKGLSEYDSYYTSTYFDHYFRHFYRILKFIKQNDTLLSYKEQYQYASILRATLSRYELVWLYYNGLSENGCEKLKPLMEHYSMLKNLRPDLLILCKNNYVLINESGLSPQNIKDAGFSNTDYEFFLTIEEKDSSKYNIKAFYNLDDLSKGYAYYDKWKQFCVKNNVKC